MLRGKCLKTNLWATAPSQRQRQVLLVSYALRTSINTSFRQRNTSAFSERARVNVKTSTTAAAARSLLKFQPRSGLSQCPPVIVYPAALKSSANSSFICFFAKADGRREV